MQSCWMEGVLFKLSVNEVGGDGSFYWTIECNRDVNVHEVVGIIQVIKQHLINEEMESGK